jgi:puromycin-sensitive aminopeptidase
VLHLSQERFRYLPVADGTERWAIPLVLRYATAGGEVATTTALLDGTDLEIDLPGELDWVVANAGASGFFRVRYAPELRAALARRSGAEVTALERYGLVDDTWAAVLAGAAPAADALALAEAMAGEDDLDVWRRLVGTLDQLDRLVDDATRPALAGQVAAILRPALDRLGPEPSEGESDRDRQLRGVLFGALATTGADADAAARARALFDRHRADPSAVDANLAAAAIRVVASSAGPAEVDAIVDGYRTSSNPQEQLRYLYALADVRDTDQHARVLELALSDEVRTQNAPFLLGSCLANRANAATAWAAVRDGWERINDRFPSNSIVRMLSGIRSIGDGALADDVTGFLAENPVPQGRQILDQHLERMRVTVALHQREADRLGGALTGGA